MSRRRQKKLPDPVLTGIESLSHEGRGIARVDGKTVFVDGALPGETVEITYTRCRGKYDEAIASRIISPAAERVEPGCRHFSVCGGCSLQHMTSEYQIQHKQSVLLEQFEHIGNVTPLELIPPLTSDFWGYRHKARLGVKYVYKKGKVLVGFREKGKPYIADIDDCRVLHPDIGNRITALKTLMDGLSIRDKVPQIEVAVGDDVTAIVIRHMAELDADDREQLVRFEENYGIRILLQSGGPDTVRPLSGENELSATYNLDKYGLAIRFDPLGFTQVNFSINRRMIDMVMSLLEPGQEDSLLDLFCGLGNFTLPLATRAGVVIGVEGSQALVARAEQNADANKISNARFYCADLYADELDKRVRSESANKILLDPPRSGAREFVEQMNFSGVQRIVYVSCNPATLARDAGLLVNMHGYSLTRAGVMDMFPHTTHVESVAVFDAS